MDALHVARDWCHYNQLQAPTMNSVQLCWHQENIDILTSRIWQPNCSQNLKLETAVTPLWRESTNLTFATPILSVEE